MRGKIIILLMGLCLILFLFPVSAAATNPTVRTLVLTENWRLTDVLDLEVPANEELIIDGADTYYIYEMSEEAVLINTGDGFVRFRDTILYHAGDAPQENSLAALLAAADGVTSIAAPARDATSLMLPTVPGYTVSIRSSSNEAVIGLDGTVTPPASATTVNLVLTLTGNGGMADTSAIPVTVPARSGGNNGGGGGSGGGGASAPAPAPTYNIEVPGSGSVPVTVNTGLGSASLDLTPLAGNLPANGNMVIDIPSIPGVNTFSANLPAASLSASGTGSITLNTGAGSLTIPDNMLSGTGLTGDAGVTIGTGDTSALPDDVKDAIGSRPVIQLTLSINGRQTAWNNPAAPVTVSIPYTPTAAELANPEGIVIWYIDGSGNAVSVPNGHYDPVTGTVTFTTTHFSYYAVVYNKVSFNDVAAGAWYGKAVGFIAARGITGGTGGDNYSPDAKLTRGDFLVMLMKSYDITAEANPTDNFSDAGNTYYTGYLAAAKRLGITAGVGNNMYAPAQEITRQEMFTLLYNVLKIVNKLPQGDSGKMLSDFSDAGQIKPWAKDAMTLLVETGVIGGNAGRLSPTATTTRAEMAQVLYNLLSK